MYIFTYMYMYMYIYVYTYIFIHTNIHTHIHTYNNIFRFLEHIYIYIYIHTNIHAYIHTTIYSDSFEESKNDVLKGPYDVCMHIYIYILVGMMPGITSVYARMCV